MGCFFPKKAVCLQTVFLEQKTFSNTAQRNRETA